MIFRLTKTAQTQLNNPVPETADAENRYCEWFVNIFRNNRKKYFLITNAYSFLSVIIPAKGITSVTAFYDAAITELKNYCDYKAIPDFFSTYIAPYTKEPKTSATNNRSVLSVMNQIKLYTEDVALETAAPEYLYDEFGKYLTLALEKEFGKIYSPHEAFISEGMKKPVYSYDAKIKDTQKSLPVYKNELGEILTDSAAIAQDLCWTAWDTEDDVPEGLRERKRLVKQALLYDKNCTDAYCILAEDSKTIGKQLEYALKAKECFEKVHDKNYFKKNTGDFYGILETRPYMRALWYYSDALSQLGRLKEAADVMEYMIELCPNDNLGVRFELAEIYKKLKDKKSLDALIKQFEGCL